MGFKIANVFNFQKFAVIPYISNMAVTRMRTLRAPVSSIINLLPVFPVSLSKIPNEEM